MKRNLQIGLLVSALLPMVGVCAHAIPIAPDEVTVQEITKPLDTRSADDYLLDMARAAQINVVADFTDFPVDSAVIPYPATSAYNVGTQGNRPQDWNSNLRSLVGDFTAQEKLTVLRAAPRTFLFWSEPDPRQLLALQGELTQAAEDARWKEAIDVAGANGTPEDEIVRGELSDAQLQSVLWNYLKSIGWKGTVAERTDHVDIQILFDELRPDLRALTLLDLQKKFVNGFETLNKPTHWNQASVRLNGDEGEEKVSVYYPEPTTEDADAMNYYALTTLKGALEIPTDAPIALMQEPRVVPIQLGTNDTLANAYKGISNETIDSALEADNSLQKPISLEVKRLSLRELLKQVEKQSDIRLTLSEDAPTDNLVTARVEKMPLSQLMGVLARVYGVTWNKTGDAAYQMNGNAQGELHLKLLQLGDPTRYRYRFSFSAPSERDAENAAIAKAVINGFGVESLKKTKGVPVSALPQQLQHRLIYALEDRSAETQVVPLFHSNQVLLDHLAKNDLILRFGNSVSKNYRSTFMGYGAMEPQDWLRFHVQSTDGKIVMPVFDSFYATIAQPGETDPHPPSRRR